MDFMAFIISFLWTGPIPTAATGTLEVLRNSSNASRDPIVEA